MSQRKVNKIYIDSNNNKNKIKNSSGDKIFIIVNYTILTIFLLSVLYPIIYIISASFSSGHAVITGQVWLFPVDFNLEGYKAIFKYKSIITGYKNSIFYMVFGTAVNIFMTLIAAYPLSRKKFVGKGLLLFLFTFTMYFGGGLIPTYLIIKQLGLINSRWVMIIPGAMSVWNVIITRTFFQTNIPEELYEATQLDGGDHFKFFSRVVIPLSKSIIAVNMLFYAVGHWNSYFGAFIYLNDESKFPLQLVLRQILVLNQFSLDMISEDAEVLALKQDIQELLKFSLIIVASLPVLIIYPFVQKHFVKGVMIGSLKG